MNNNRKKHSLFWPVVLVGVGIVWLLYNLNMITGVNLAGAFQFWPLLLIGVGLDVLLGRRYPVISALIGLLVVSGMLVLVMAGPTLGLVKSPEMVTETFVAPAGLARRANLEVQFTTGENQIRPLSGTQDLLVATAVHSNSGTVEFSDSGTTTRSIKLSGPHPESGVFLWPSFPGEESWDVAISPNVPVDLNLNVSSGEIDVQLTGMKIESTSIQVSSGSTTVALPATGKPYQSDLTLTSGSLTINFPPDVETLLESRITSGRLTFNLPSSSPVRFEVTRKTSGTIRLPDRFQLVSGEAGVEGVWEATGSDPSAPLIEITVEITSGNVIVQ